MAHFILSKSNKVYQSSLNYLNELTGKKDSINHIMCEMPVDCPVVNSFNEIVDYLDNEISIAKKTIRNIERMFGYVMTWDFVHDTSFISMVCKVLLQDFRVYDKDKNQIVNQDDLENLLMSYQSFSVCNKKNRRWFKYDLYEIFKNLSNIVTNEYSEEFKIIVCDNKQDYEIYHLFVMRLNNYMPSMW